MTTLTRFAPPTRRTVVRAGMLARDYGRDRLSTEFFHLALAEDQVDLGITGAVIRAEIKARTAWQDRELLAALGIDLDEVRRRVLDTMSTRLDDPSLWQLPDERAAGGRQRRSSGGAAAAG
jgi:hypothetical protein